MPGPKKLRKKARLALFGGVSAGAIVGLGGGALAQETTSGSTDEIVVEGRRYFTESTNLTRSDAKLIEIPNSLTILSKDILEDQIVTNFNDALSNVAGVQVADSNGIFNDANIQLRGVALGDDGISTVLRENSLAGGLTYTADPYVVERIEVIKGPAAIAGGGASVGGLINRVLKTANDEDQTEVLVTADTFGFARAGVDINGALNDDRSLMGRIVVVGGAGEGPFQRETQNTVSILPSFKYDLSDRTEIVVQGQYVRIGGTPFGGIGVSAESDELPDIDPDFNWNFDDDGLDRDETHLSAQADVVHEFLDDLTLTARVGYGDTSQELIQLYSFNYAPGLPASGDADIYSGFRDRQTERFAADVFLTKDFELPNGLQSSFVLGVDRVRQDQTRLNTFQFLGTDNIFDPQIRFEVPNNIREENVFGETDISLIQTGVYSQLVLRPFEGATLVGGLRYDWFDQTADVFLFSVETDTFRRSEVQTTEGELTWRAGGSYDVGFGTNVYVSYSTSFLSNAFELQENGELLSPEQGRQIEGGFKSNLFNDSLFLTTSAFRIRRDGVAAPDPDTPRFSLPGIELELMGIEVEALGEITPGFNIVGAYSYIEGEILDDGVPDDSPEPQLDGTDIVGLANHNLSLFATYEIQNGPWAGFGGGARIRHQSRAGFGADFAGGIPAFTTFDLTVFYRDIVDGVDLRLYAENVTDEFYLPSFGGFNGLRFGAQRNVTFSLTAAF